MSKSGTVTNQGNTVAAEDVPVSKKLQLNDQQSMLLPHDIYKEQT